MPCNTAHFFLKVLQKNITIPILNMITATADAVCERGLDTVGLLATDGTLKSGIYHDALASHHIKTITPSPPYQKILMDAIYLGVKAGNLHYRKETALRFILKDMRSRGAQGFILGCTELPLLFTQIAGYEFIDPTRILAQKAIASIGKKVRRE